METKLAKFLAGEPDWKGEAIMRDKWLAAEGTALRGARAQVAFAAPRRSILWEVSSPGCTDDLWLVSMQISGAPEAQFSGALPLEYLKAAVEDPGRYSALRLPRLTLEAGQSAILLLENRGEQERRFSLNLRIVWKEDTEHAQWPKHQEQKVPGDVVEFKRGGPRTCG